MEKIKKLLDVIMGVMFLGLMKIGAIGVNFHEIGGLIFFVFISLHNVINFRWMKKVSERFFTRKVSSRVKFQFVLNIILFLFNCLTIFSGILISQTIFVSLAVENIAYWSTLHYFFAYMSLVFLSVHVGLHWQRILFFLRHLFGMSRVNTFRIAFSRIMAFTIFVFGLKIMVQSEMKEKFIAPFQREEISVEEKPQLNKKRRKSEAYQELRIGFTTMSATEETLEDYLGKLFCTGCGKHCILTQLQCGRGNQYREEAITAFSTQQGLTEDGDLNLETTITEEHEIEFYEIGGLIGFFVVISHYGSVYFAQVLYFRQRRSVRAITKRKE